MNTTPPRMEIKTVVICDDARREDNGKSILIGVYNSDMIFPSFPASTSLTFWIQFMPTQVGEISFQFRLLGGEDVEFVKGEFKFAASAKELSSIPLKLPVIPFQAPIGLALEIKYHASDWEKIATLGVKKGVPGAQALAVGN
jgi:hypothetical protein